jgi:gamma-glutamyl hercynylcysteine S-oxide synthase
MDTIAEASHRSGWPDFSVFRPHPPGATLAAWLRESQALTDSLCSVIDGKRLEVPKIRIVNPPLWEIGHVGWFQEFWMHRCGSFEAPSMIPGADKLYDSARVHHDTRWSLDLPDLDATRRYLNAVLERSLEMIDRGPLTDELTYFTQLSILHQDMHNEAFCNMWQTLGYPAPLPAPLSAARGADRNADTDSTKGDVEIPARRLLLGAAPASGFIFDNEKWGHEVEVSDFEIARHAVTNTEFLAFVEDGGYRRREFWSDAGWRMLAELALAAPRYWRRDGDSWRVRRFDREIVLDPAEPVMHVSFHEAESYCRWAGRRLPTEVEWECAAATSPGDRTKRRYPWGDVVDRPVEWLAQLDARCAGPAAACDFPAGRSGWGALQMLGNVWEWTSSRFAPYPGFAADPYKEYSAPWFVDDHRVLRGGSFATPLRLIRNTWRNFYLPHRADIFCGFRTCAA